jgi:hypothetical protein
MNADAIRLLTVQRDGDDGVIVSFSDGTTGAYVAEELLELRPYREPCEFESGSGSGRGRTEQPIPSLP